MFESRRKEAIAVAGATAGFATGAPQTILDCDRDGIIERTRGDRGRRVFAPWISMVP